MAAEEVEALRAANAKLLADLQQERGLRQKAELAQQQLEADREKAQRARDEVRGLASQRAGAARRWGGQGQ